MLTSTQNDIEIYTLLCNNYRLSKNILILGIVNLVLSPVIFLWEILYLFFVYGNLVKREPGFLGSRTW